MGRQILIAKDGADMQLMQDDVTPAIHHTRYEWEPKAQEIMTCTDPQDTTNTSTNYNYAPTNNKHW